MCLPFFLFVSGGSRTPGLLDRNQTLYPAELRRQTVLVDIILIKLK